MRDKGEHVDHNVLKSTDRRTLEMADETHARHQAVGTTDETRPIHEVASADTRPINVIQPSSPDETQAPAQRTVDLYRRDDRGMPMIGGLYYS